MTSYGLLRSATASTSQLTFNLRPAMFRYVRYVLLRGSPQPSQLALPRHVNLLTKYAELSSLRRLLVLAA